MKRRQSEAQDQDSHQNKKARNSVAMQQKMLCFFCDKDTGTEELHEEATFQLDANVKRAAEELQDLSLISKLSAGDMIAQEAKYHKNCLTALYNKVRNKMSKSDVLDSNEIDIDCELAFAELLAYIDENRSEDTLTVFKLAELSALYQERLQQLGASIEGRTHSTRLKTHLMAHYPDMKAYTKGRNILLSFDADIGNALYNTHENYASHFAQTARVIRKEIFSMSANFGGSFKKNCQAGSISKSLK